MENIILIGMSGAGKSTLGVLLAKALGMDFIDTDILIQRREGLLLHEILRNEGTDGFLCIEEEVLRGLRVQGSVVATGGSAVYSERAIENLRDGGRTVYLRVSYEELSQRLQNIKTRGIVMRKGESLRDVYLERLPLYEKYADITIDCTGSVEQSVERLVAMFSAGSK